MAAFVFTAKTFVIGTTWSAPATAPGLGAGVTIAGTISGGSDISAYATGGDVGWSANMLDITNFASGGFEQSIPGLTAGDDINIPLNADFAAAAMWPILQTVFGSPLGISRPGDAVRYLDVKPTSSARGSTNPSAVFGVYAMGIQQMSGSVGDKASMALVLKVTGGFSVLTA